MSTARVLLVPVYVLYTIWHVRPIMLRPLCMDLLQRCLPCLTLVSATPSYVSKIAAPLFCMKHFFLFLWRGIQCSLVHAYGVV